MSIYIYSSTKLDLSCVCIKPLYIYIIVVNGFIFQKKKSASYIYNIRKMLGVFLVDSFGVLPVLCKT
jgi:hypothetical protein